MMTEEQRRIKEFYKEWKEEDKEIKKFTKIAFAKGQIRFISDLEIYLEKNCVKFQGGRIIDEQNLLKFMRKRLKELFEKKEF